jgi:hypothetical protein
MNTTFEFKGKTYKIVSENSNGSCNGCSGKSDRDLCCHHTDPELVGESCVQGQFILVPYESKKSLDDAVCSLRAKIISKRKSIENDAEEYLKSIFKYWEEAIDNDFIDDYTEYRIAPDNECSDAHRQAILKLANASGINARFDSDGFHFSIKCA